MEISAEDLAYLSDRLTHAIRGHDLSAIASVRDHLDVLAGREPWNSTMPPRPPLDYTPPED